MKLPWTGDDTPGLTAGDRWALAWQQCASAVRDGRCPVHGAGLIPVLIAAAPCAGHCVLCRKYWFLHPVSGEPGWQADHRRAGEAIVWAVPGDDAPPGPGGPP